MPPPPAVQRGPVWPHLQHHAAERLPVGAHVQVHQRVPGGGGGVAGAAAAAGAGRGEAQRRGARDRAQAEQVGAAAQRQHSDAGRWVRVGMFPLQTDETAEKVTRNREE